LGQKIKRIFKASAGTYGTRRIRETLKVEGIFVGRGIIRKKMKQYGLVAKARRKTRMTTNSNHSLPIADNLLGQRFFVPEPNRVWVCDISYFQTTQGWLYLAIVLDLFSRQIVGWAVSTRMKKELVIEALSKAYWSRKPSPGLICHSDRGSQYCSHEYRKLLHGFQMKQSMSRKGQCLDNACAETFFHSMKVEWFYGNPLMSRHFTLKAIREYIEVFYNRNRLHSTLGYRSPCQFESLHLLSKFFVSA
jgi:transposase InsO family protein